MTDLVMFIEARLAEDERTALAATRNAWAVDSWASDNGVEFLVVADHDQGAPAFAIKNEQDAAHIARHDPARVLRDVAAARAVLAEYQHARQRRAEHPDDVASAGALLTMVRVMKLLARAWDGHPDYQAEWSA